MKKKKKLLPKLSIWPKHLLIKIFTELNVTVLKQASRQETDNYQVPTFLVSQCQNYALFHILLNCKYASVAAACYSYYTHCFFTLTILTTWRTISIHLYDNMGPLAGIKLHFTV